MIVPKTELDLPTSLLDFRETINEIISRNDVTSVSGGGNLSTDGISYFNSIINNGSAEVSKVLESRILRHYCGTSLAALRMNYQNHVFKVYRIYPKLNENGHCGAGKLCGCFGDSVEILKKYAIFDLTEDPYEDSPLMENSYK